jgi:hypothetical protein
LQLKISEELEYAFGVVGKTFDEQGFNGISLVRFGFKMSEIFIFKVISAAENSNKFPKNQVLEGKISLRIGCGNTWVDLEY